QVRRGGLALAPGDQRRAGLPVPVALTPAQEPGDVRRRGGLQRFAVRPGVKVQPLHRALPVAEPLNRRFSRVAIAKANEHGALPGNTAAPHIMPRPPGTSSESRTAAPAVCPRLAPKLQPVTHVSAAFAGRSETSSRGQSWQK